MIDFTVNAPGTVSPTGHATAGESWPSSWYVRADVLDALDRALARLPVERTPALSAHAAAVYEILLEQPTYRSMTGPELIKALENRNIFTEQSTLTSRIVPELKPYGVENKPRIGYRIPEEKRPSR